jgi:DNA-binding transcriptional regulator LsrR (DeoR family)
MKPFPHNTQQKTPGGSSHATDRSDFVARAAWMYYMEDMTQQEIAECLGVSRIKVLRMIKSAREDGIVEIKVRSPIEKTIKLEVELRSLFHLASVVVTLPEGEEKPLNKVLAYTATQILEQRLKPGIQVGIGIGRTTSYLSEFFAPEQRVDCTFVSLAGGLSSRENIEDSYETILKLASLAGGEGKYIIAPFLVSSAEIRAAVLQDKAVESAIEQARNVDLAIFSVGTPDDFALLHQYNLLTAKELSEIRSLGAVGDALGRFFDKFGNEVITGFSDRVIGLSIDELRAIPVRILAAGGQKKYKAIRAALIGKIANILVTDVTTAEWLVNNKE